MPLKSKDNEDYFLRLMTPQTIGEDWPRWLADHALMRQINAVPAKLTKAKLGSYVTVMAAQNTGVVGIFRKRDGAHAGIYEVKIDPQHRLANLSVLIDFKAHDIATAFGTTETVLLKSLSERYGAQKAFMVVPASYTRFLRVPEQFDWQKEGEFREEFVSAGDKRQRVSGICFGKLIDLAKATISFLPKGDS